MGTTGPPALAANRTVPRHFNRSGTSMTVHYGPDALTLDIVNDGPARTATPPEAGAG